MEHPSGLDELPLQAHVLIDERGDVDVALAFHFARRPDDGQLPHPVRPAPALDDDLLAAPLEDPLVLHERRYRPFCRATLREPSPIPPIFPVFPSVDDLSGRL